MSIAPSPAVPPEPVHGRAVPNALAGPGGVNDLPAAGDPAADPFESILAAHGAELFRYLRRLSPSAEDAADLHQETFLRAFRAYPRLEPGANVRAWLYRIAGNLARDAHRRRVVRSAATGAGLDGEVGASADHAADPATHALDLEAAAAVREGLLALTSRQRVAVVRRVLEEAEYADVAAALGCSEATARQHVSQGLRRLRSMLTEPVEMDA